MTRTLAFLLFILATTADLKTPPMSGPRERGAAIVRNKEGHERSKNQWTMERTIVDGKPVLRFTEEGRGIRSPNDDEIRWTILSLWTDESPPHPLWSESTTSDSEGKPLMTESRIFDFARKQVEIKKTDSRSGKAERETVKIPSDTLAADGLAGILRGLDFTGAKTREAHLLTGEGKIYDVTFEARGKEKLQTEDGEVECYKIEVVPHLGMLNLIRFFYPKTYFWFEVASPHTWVRYAGSETGPGSPEVVMQRSKPPSP